MKTVEMENYLDNMAFEIFGRGRKVAMDNQLCVMCGGDANYFISGMCQECQDKTFA